MTQVTANPYKCSLEHLTAEIAVLDLLLAREVQLVRSRHASDTGADFQGLFVSTSPFVRRYDVCSRDTPMHPLVVSM